MSILDTLPTPIDAARDTARRLTTGAYSKGKSFLGTAPDPSSLPVRIGSSLLGALLLLLGASTLVVLASWLLGLYTMLYAIVWLLVKLTGSIKGLL